MSSILAVDWHRNRVHLVAAAIGNRGSVRFDRALVWEEPEELTEATAEAAGRRFARRLKDEHIAPGPLLISLGRERIVFKEIRIPIVGPAEEPAIVRFQASKELTEAPDSVVIDYAPLHGLGGDGERRAMLLVARRTQIDACKKFCQAAGLKLAGITPRPFGVAACLKTAAVQAPRGTAAAVLIVAEKFAEFVVVSGQNLVFARTISPNANLIADVRRNLALYAGQPVHSSRDGVASLYIAGGNPTLCCELQDALPVHELDPLGKNFTDLTDRGAFTGAVGLVHAWADGQQLSINFVAPKEPKPVVNTSRQKLVLAGAGGFLCLIAMVFVGMLLSGAKATELDDKKIELEEAESTIKRLQPESKQIAALTEWQKSALPIIDEIYDLTARFPYRVGFQLDELSITPPPTVANSKEPHSLRLLLTGNVPRSEVKLVQQLIDTINRDKHSRATLVSLREATSESDAAADMQRFSIRVDVAPRPLNQYTTRIPGGGTP